MNNVKSYNRGDFYTSFDNLKAVHLQPGGDKIITRNEPEPKRSRGE